VGERRYCAAVTVESAVILRAGRSDPLEMPWIAARRRKKPRGENSRSRSNCNLQALLLKHRIRVC
jgi:hypothetical protein